MGGVRVEFHLPQCHYISTKVWLTDFIRGSAGVRQPSETKCVTGVSSACQQNEQGCNGLTDAPWTITNAGKSGRNM